MKTLPYRSLTIILTCLLCLLSGSMALAVVKPDASGIITLSVPDCNFHGMRGHHRVGNQPILSYWQSPEARASWKAEIPESGKYIFEVTYASANRNAATLLVKANEQKLLEWVIPRTRVWGDYYSPRVTEVELSRGILDLELSVPDCQGNGPALMYVRLIPVALKKRMDELRKRTRLGMSVDQLELLWGKAVNIDPYPIGKNWGGGDRDWTMLKQLEPFCTYRMWKSDDAFIKAAFYEDKALNIVVEPFEKSPEIFLQMTAAVMPGVVFRDTDRMVKGKLFASYSSDADNKFQLQCDKLGLQVNAVAYARMLTGKSGSVIVDKQDKNIGQQLAERQTRNAREKNRNGLLSKPRIGMDLRELTLLMGKNGTRGLWWDLVSYTWQLDDGFELAAAFQNGVCVILVVSHANEFPPSTALDIIEHMLPKTKFDKEIIIQNARNRQAMGQNTEGPRKYSAMWMYKYNKYHVEVTDPLRRRSR